MSPILFSIVIDSLLRNLEATGQGLSISGQYLGASEHADDLRAFFATGALGAFWGKCNPLTGHSIFETFAIPVLLYGCETWTISHCQTRKI